MTAGTVVRVGVFGAVAAFVSALAMGSPTTASYLYDLETIPIGIEAGEWLAIPVECDEVLKHPHTSVIEGTAGDDTLPTPGGTASPGGDDDKPNFGQVVIGYAGNDQLTGGNQHDCLVGGPGNDLLIGGNGKDILIGGDGIDECRGGNGPEVVYIGCETIVRGNGNDGGNANGDENPKDKDKDKSSGATTQQAPAPVVPEPEESEPVQSEQPAPSVPDQPSAPTDPTEEPEPTDDVVAPTDPTESADPL